MRILLITSRGTRRWVIPKGWPMRGLKPQEAAAVEAAEEAGIVGEVEDQPDRLLPLRQAAEGRATHRRAGDRVPLPGRGPGRRLEGAGPAHVRVVPLPARPPRLVAEPAPAPPHPRLRAPPARPASSPRACAATATGAPSPGAESRARRRLTSAAHSVAYGNSRSRQGRP